MLKTKKVADRFIPYLSELRGLIIEIDGIDTWAETGWRLFGRDGAVGAWELF